MDMESESLAGVDLFLAHLLFIKIPSMSKESFRNWEVGEGNNNK